MQVHWVLRLQDFLKSLLCSCLTRFYTGLLVYVSFNTFVWITLYSIHSNIKVGISVLCSYEVNEGGLEHVVYKLYF